MPEVRVFELAKELNLPAKDLLVKMRKAGIPVTGNFSELSSEQAEIVRKMGKSAKGIILPKSAKGPGKVRLRSTEKKPEGTDKVKESKTTKKSKIVTISTKSKLDEEEVVATPKRRVRKKRTELVHSSEDSTVQVADKLKTDSEIERISADAKKDRLEKPVLESELSKIEDSKISTLESQDTLPESGDPSPENRVEPNADTVEDSKQSKLTALERYPYKTVLLMMKSLQNQKKNQRKLKYFSNTLKLMTKNSHQKTEVPDPRNLRTNEGEVVDREIIIIFVKEDLAAAEKTFQKIDWIAKFPAKFLILMHKSTYSIHVKKASE